MHNCHIERDLKTDLKKHITNEEITLITGARQVGKTTLMEILEQELLEKNQNTIFLNLDIEKDYSFFSSQEKLIKKLELDFGNKFAYVFIDEIQRKENAGLFLKGLYDMQLNYKFIVSGSGSLELKEKISESLQGRKRSFELRPISLREFLNHRTQYKYKNKLADYISLETESFSSLLEEYLNFGGYPKIVNTKTLEDKLASIGEIYSSYLDKDIRSIVKLERPDAFIKMIQLLAANTGQTLNYSNLASQTGLATETLKKYIYYAEHTCCIKTVKPFFKNKTKEITKSPKIYFNDIGLKNYAIDEFGTLTRTDELSFSFENLVYDMLLLKYQNSAANICFWRTTDKAEVDFIIDKGKAQIPVEVKYSHLNKTKIPASLKSFIRKYQPEEAWIINLSLDEEIDYEGSKVKFKTIASLLRN